MAKQTVARPAAAARPPRPAASVPAFGGWEAALAAGGKAEAPDYSLDFTKIRAARMRRRTKALSWSSFVGNAAVDAVETTPGGGGGGGVGGEEEEKRQCSSAATSDGDDGDDDREGRRHRHHRRLRSDDFDADERRQPIQPGRAAPKGRSKSFKGYLFGCVGGQW